MLVEGIFVDTVHHHILLDLLKLGQLLRQMLIGSLEREVGLEVHLGTLLQQMAFYHCLHTLSLLLRQLLLLSDPRLHILLLEVFELKLLSLLDRIFIFILHRLNVLLRADNGVLDLTRVLRLILKLRCEVGTLNPPLAALPVLMVVLKPCLFGLTHTIFGFVQRLIVVSSPSCHRVIVILQTVQAPVFVVLGFDDAALCARLSVTFAIRAQLTGGYCSLMPAGHRDV